ncbi:MAG: 2'-5' RNA ligase family protein [Akkermansiaceae bacterium]|nr:2'-5' RNA ligase family protein [Armatimonadota bacterium]
MSDSKSIPGVADNCAVCLYFDADTDAAVRRIWDAIAGAGISDEMSAAGWRPHITLSGCRDLRLEEYLPALRDFAARSEPLEIAFTSVGYFGGKAHHTLFLAPTATGALLDLHERHHRLVFPLCASVSPYYAPGGWVPHSTLALSLSKEKLARAVELIDISTPITGTLEAVGMVRVARPRVQELGVLPIGHVP